MPTPLVQGEQVLKSRRSFNTGCTNNVAMTHSTLGGNELDQFFVLLECSQLFGPDLDKLPIQLVRGVAEELLSGVYARNKASGRMSQGYPVITQTVLCSSQHL